MRQPRSPRTHGLTPTTCVVQKAGDLWTRWGSRVLEGFASAGLISSSRWRAEIVDKEGMRERAEM